MFILCCITFLAVRVQLGYYWILLPGTRVGKQVLKISVKNSSYYSLVTGDTIPRTPLGAWVYPLVIN